MQSIIDMESIQSELQKCYTNPQLVEQILQQVKELPLSLRPALKSYHNYVAITLSLPSRTDNYCFKVHPSMIEFVVVLTRGYPLSAPRVHLKTCIISPGFDDCRNLMYELLGGHEWDYKTRLANLSPLITDFLSKQGSTKNVYSVARTGQFCVNMVYPVELIKEIRGTQIYFAFEYDSTNNLKMLVADISSTHIAFFLTKQQPELEKGAIKIPNEHDVTDCMLTFVAELGSLCELLISRLNFSDIQLKFTCSKLGTSVCKKLKIRKGQSFLKKLTQSLNNFDLVDIKYEPHPENIETEQRECLAEVAAAETQLAHRFNKQTIEKLANAYQKVAEFYSSNNMPFYAIFVQKITILFQRPDVKLILEAETGLTAHHFRQAPS